MPPCGEKATGPLPDQAGEGLSERHYSLQRPFSVNHLKVSIVAAPGLRGLRYVWDCLG